MGFFRRKIDHSRETPPEPLCSCGRPLDQVDMSYGFQLPDEVFGLPEDELRARIRGLARVFVLDDSRGFVRTLLPVRLDQGSVEFGVWLEVPASQAQAAIKAWEEPAYASLTFAGEIANHLPPWGELLVGARATAAPTSQDELPVVNGGDEVVRSMLDRAWARADVVAALPSLEHTH